jgi:hypothetical protein
METPSTAPVSLPLEDGGDLDIDEANSPANAKEDTNKPEIPWDEFIEDPNPNSVVEPASAQGMEMGNSKGEVRQASMLKETLTDFG